MNDRIQVVCTGRGGHPMLEVGILIDRRESREAAAAGMENIASEWADPRADDLREMAAELRAEPRGIYYTGTSQHVTNRGGVKVTKRSLPVIQRTDGGRTFALTCPRCRKPGHGPRYAPMREESAARLFDSGVSRLDISLI